MKISVKQKHIERGKGRSKIDCPIALAMREAFTDSSVCVYPKFYHIRYDGIDYALPQTCTEFIDDFDNKRPVKPFSFRIKDPRE